MNHEPWEQTGVGKRIAATPEDCSDLPSRGRSLPDEPASEDEKEERRSEKIEHKDKRGKGKAVQQNVPNSRFGFGRGRGGLSSGFWILGCGSRV
eukprot:2810742-Rhodomonas_salina.2